MRLTSFPAIAVERFKLAVSRDQATLWLFSATIFLSAYLLFLIQPMFAKMVLPLLGGAPAVWAVAMVFFQTTLLLGYCYAHLIIAKLSLRTGVLVHLCVLASAVIFLPLGISEYWSNPPTENLQLWVFGLLAVSIGLPFFAVSGNGPLLQAWFARSGHDHAGDPYFLYAASNLGSLLALLAYPVLMEPNLSLAGQSLFWSGGYISLVLVIAICAAVIVSVQKLLTNIGTGSSSVPGAKVDTSSLNEQNSLAGSEVSWNDRFYWIALAGVPSGLLIAVTNYITTDLAPIPFFWIVPLALFLLTFVITFQKKPILSHELMSRYVYLSIIAMFVVFFRPADNDLTIKMAITLLAFFSIAMTCHGELVKRRPGTNNITEFYLYMSVGGMLGGMFTALLAPQIFSFIAEYPIMIMLAALVRPGLWSNIKERLLEEKIFLGSVAGLCAVMLSILYVMDVPFKANHLQFVVAAFAAALIIWQANVVRFAGLVLIFINSALFLSTTMTRGDFHRGFFGVHQVAESSDKKLRRLIHGSTIHGAQRISKGLSEEERLEPLTYYHWLSPFADILGLRNSTKPINNIAVVGLGTGSLACYAKPGENWRYFEIDPLVAKIASDKNQFTFLSSCTPGAPIILGDARLTLVAETGPKFDYIILDAFSSDSVPMHLLTLEAFEGYLSRLSDDGVLAIHISNRHIDLAPVLSAAAKKLGLSGLVKQGPNDLKAGKTSARLVVLSRNPDRIASLKTEKKWKDLPAPAAKAWTDDYSNLLGAMRIFN